MNKKILWKIEALWEKYFLQNSRLCESKWVFRSQENTIRPTAKQSHDTCHSECISESKVLEKNNICPANDIQLAKITIENNSPFGFYSKKQNKCHPTSNSYFAIPAKAEIHKSHKVVIPVKAEISIFKKLYKNNISLYNPDFQKVQKFDFESSKKPVHSDDYGEYFGLKKIQVLDKDGKLIYLFDNHNKIIQPFLEYAEVFGKGFDVVHIDAHDDDAVFAGQKPQNLELGKVQGYIMQTRISDFFDFLSEVSLRRVEQDRDDKTDFVIASVTERNESISEKQEIPEIASQARDDNSVSLQGVKRSEATKQSRKLIQNIYRYTKSFDFQTFKKPKNPYILSLDIDIFGPEGDFVDLESKVKIIAEAWQHADVVCIATSPGFIDQGYAEGIIKILIQCLF